MMLHGRGDYELMAIFDLENDAQVKLALWASQARRHRSVKVTEEMREHLRAIRPSRRTQRDEPRIMRLVQLGARASQLSRVVSALRRHAGITPDGGSRDG